MRFLTLVIPSVSFFAYSFAENDSYLTSGDELGKFVDMLDASKHECPFTGECRPLALQLTADGVRITDAQTQSELAVQCMNSDNGFSGNVPVAQVPAIKTFSDHKDAIDDSAEKSLLNVPRAQGLLSRKAFSSAQLGNNSKITVNPCNDGHDEVAVAAEMQTIIAVPLEITVIYLEKMRDAENMKKLQDKLASLNNNNEIKQAALQSNLPSIRVSQSQSLTVEGKPLVTVNSPLENQQTDTEMLDKPQTPLNPLNLYADNVDSKPHWVEKPLPVELYPSQVCYEAMVANSAKPAPPTPQAFTRPSEGFVQQQRPPGDRGRQYNGNVRKPIPTLMEKPLRVPDVDIVS